MAARVRPRRRPKQLTGREPGTPSVAVDEHHLVHLRGGVVRVVGIGASAGGLDAFIELLSAIPGDTGFAFVLIQHLDPHHASMLAGILGGATMIPVTEAVDGVVIEADHIYVIPPDTELILHDDTLRLARRTAKVPHRPLDTFFRSLALARESDAIGVVLSGSDSDGSVGLQLIQEAGGVTFAQTPASAKFDVMPRASAGAAEFVLSPVEIADALVEIARNDRSSTRAPGAEFHRILQVMRTHSAVDFHHFKRASIERRIQRRVLLGNHDGLASYIQALEDDPGAIEMLYQDLLIGVTSFFREPDRFEALKSTVFPAIVQNRTSADRVRLWVAGCSTGQEVYSLAISLLEFLDGRADPPAVTIYGTDVNEKSLRKARAGFYAAKELSGVSPERLRRFFTPASGGQKVSRQVRGLCVFAAHDVTRDPPYSRIDLVTCCNVLIYFEAELQKKAVALIQYALAPGGFLMLGSSENLRVTSGPLTTMSTRPLIYRKRPLGASLLLFGAGESSSGHAGGKVEIASLVPQRIARPSADDDAFLSRHFAPCGVLVDEEMEITHIRGDIAPFLGLEPGEASFNLFKLVRHPEVLAVLRPALRRAFSDRIPIPRADVLVVDGGVPRRVVFEVIPYPRQSPAGSGCWIVFQSLQAPSTRKVKAAAARTEMDSLRQALSAAIDDHEELAGEAAAAAEDAQSSDEELRSANEELETAKEELQSFNEELSTLNDELLLRNGALVRMHDDIENFLGAVEIPILFIGADLTVRRFNLSAGSLFHLKSEDSSMHIREMKASMDLALLEKLVGAVITTGTAADVEVQNSAGDWRLLRIRAYRTSGGAIDGAVVAVVDINMLKRSVLVAEEATRAANVLSQASALLASSLDYETTLASLAGLATAAFADWCSVDLLNEDGSIRHLTVSHSNSVLRDLALQFQQATFREPESAPGAPQALRLRKSVLLTDIAGWESTGVEPQAKVTQLIEALGVRSLISVPLIVRDRVLGTTTFSSSRRTYNSSDLQLAEELSQRAAIAIDTAMLFREAEAANRYKDQFLATVAHELRTPLTSIIGWVQLARSTPELHDEALSHIDEGASVLRVFTEDLLDVARIREQKLSMEITEVDLAAVVRSGIEITTPSAAARRLQVQLHLGLDPAPVRGDGVRLLQVVWNLLSNAIKFTPPTGRIDVRLEQDGTNARLSVADNGAGISPEFAPHVFELYRQADETSSHLPGLGIGLAVVANIVRLHGGKVCVESPGIGLGATFIVTVPLRD